MADQLALPLGFNPEMGFDQFWPGTNQELVAHLRNLAENNGETFTFIWGQPGSGKTHLLNASCALSARAGKSSVYLPLRELNPFGPEALEGSEHFGLVCIDDLHLITGQATWEMAIFELFNRLRDSQRQLLISASMPPGQLALDLPDLASRLTWGLTLKLHRLSDTDILRALELKADALGLELPEAVGNYLMNHATRDLAALTSLLEQLDTASLAAQRKLSIPFVRNFVRCNHA